MRRLSLRLVDAGPCAAVLAMATLGLATLASAPGDAAGPLPGRAGRGPAWSLAAARGPDAVPADSGAAASTDAFDPGSLAPPAGEPGPPAGGGGRERDEAPPGDARERGPDARDAPGRSGAPDDVREGSSGPHAAPAGTPAPVRGASAGAPDAPEAPGRVAGAVVADALPGGTTVVVVARAERSSDEAGRARADPSGRYALELPAGRYRLEAHAEGHASTRVDVRVRAGAEVAARALRLVPAAAVLAGTVVTPLGHGVTGARVTVERRDRVPVTRQAVADGKGAFRVDGLPDGLYTVRAEAGGCAPAARRGVAVVAGRCEVCPALVLQPEARLCCVVRDPDGRVAAGVAVTAYRRRRAVATGRTDERGACDLGALSAGGVDVFARAGLLTARASAALEAGRDVVLELALAGAPAIAGRVADDEGAPRAGVLVVASSREGDVRARARTGPDGSYELHGLVPGRYVVSLPRRRSPPLARADADTSRGSVRCDLVARDGTTLRGTVVEPNGTFVPRADVRLVSGGRERASARTDGQGRFRLRGLPAGEALVLVRARRDRVVVEQTILLCDDGLVEGLVLVARPPSRLRGVVLDAAGQPLGGVALVARGGTVQLAGTTRADGRFDLTPLFAGEHRLAADAGSLRLVAARRGVAEVALEPVTFVAAAGGADLDLELRATETPLPSP